MTAGPDHIDRDPPRHSVPLVNEHCIALAANGTYYTGTSFLYHYKSGVTVSISASEARKQLFPLLEQVNTDHQPVRITSRGGDAVLMSADDYDSWQETVYLLRSPENARRLMEAVARDREGQATPTKSIDELREMAGGEA